MSVALLHRCLLPAAAAVHAADQLVLLALPPLVLLLLPADPASVGLLLAAHSAAWLVLSLPVGMLADTIDPRRLLISAQLVAASACLAAGLALQAQQLALLAIAVFVGSAGLVAFVGTVTALLPLLPLGLPLAVANSRLELARGGAALLAPVAVTLLLAWHVGELLLPAAAMLMLLAAACLQGLKAALPPERRIVRPLAVDLRSAGRFLIRHSLLRPVALCSLFWNFAFFALAAAYMPFAMGVGALAPAQAAATQGAYGAGALLAGLCGGWLLARRRPLEVLLFGPAVSVLAVLSILAMPGLAGSEIGAAGIALAGIGWFLIGFGPVLWSICQTTLRQLVTPVDLLGRVAATIQTANYGARPLGALCGGAVAAAWDPTVAVAFAGSVFIASFAVSLLSPLARLSAWPGRPAVAAAG